MVTNHMGLSNQTIPCDVPGIGTFAFRRRTFRDGGRIGGQYFDFTGGVQPPDGSWLDFVALAYASLKVLTAQAPMGWDIDGLDPESDADYRKLMEVFGALRAVEMRFRGTDGTAGQTGGSEHGRDGGAVVSAPIQPAAQ